MLRPLLPALVLAALAAPAAAATPAPAPDCPAPTGRPARLAFAAADLATPHYTDVIAGGRLDLAACPGTGGQGRVTPEPDFDVEIAGLAPGRAVELRTAGACDTVLLVATAEGWRFDDDGAGRGDARLRLAAGDGRFQVWVGTWGPASCRARLIVETVR